MSTPIDLDKYRRRYEKGDTCWAMILRSQRHPVADLKCTNQAAFTFEGDALCGVHLRQRLVKRTKEHP